MLTAGYNVQFVELQQRHAQRAAELRAHHNLKLPDALQVAVALTAGCDAFLTNDADLRRIPNLRVLLVDELEL